MKVWISSPDIGVEPNKSRLETLVFRKPLIPSILLSTVVLLILHLPT